MRILILDDNEDRHRVFAEKYFEHELVHAYGYYEATDALSKNGKFDLVHLDHDLGDFPQLHKPDREASMYGSRELTGYDVAVYMFLDLPVHKRPDLVIVHSINPDGAHSIEMFLERHGFGVRRVPFCDADIWDRCMTFLSMLMDDR